MGRSIWKEWLPWLVPVPIYFSPLASLFLPIFLSLRAHAEPRAFYIFMPIWLSVVGLAGSTLDMLSFSVFLLEGYLLAKLRPAAYVSVNCVLSVAGVLGLHYVSPNIISFQFYETFKAEMSGLFVSMLDQGAFKGFDWVESKTRPELQDFFLEALLLFILVMQSIASVIYPYMHAAFTKSNDRFRDFRSSDGCIWLFIACFGLFLLPYEVCAWPARAGLAALIPVYFLQGLAIVISYLRLHGIVGFWRMLVLALVLYTLHFVVFLFGLFDLWFDFRRRLEVKD